MDRSAVGRRGARRLVFGAALQAAVALIAAACGDPPAPDTPSDGQAPSAGPQIACLGLPASKCAEFLKQAVLDGRGVPVSAIRIVCTKAPCTERQGEVAIDVLYASGLRNSTGSGWSTVGGGAPPPVPAATVPAPFSPASPPAGHDSAPFPPAPSA